MIEEKKKPDPPKTVAKWRKISESSSSVEISSETSEEVLPTKKREFKAVEKQKEEKEQANPNIKEFLAEASTKPLEPEEPDANKTFFEKLAERGCNLEGVKSVEKPGQKVTLKQATLFSSEGKLNFVKPKWAIIDSDGE